MEIDAYRSEFMIPGKRMAHLFAGRVTGERMETEPDQQRFSSAAVGGRDEEVDVVRTATRALVV